MSLVPDPTIEHDSDARLAAILDNLTADLLAGRPVELERVAQAHPDLEVEIRQLWEAVLIAEQFGKPDGNPISPRHLASPPSHTVIRDPGAAPEDQFAAIELLDEIGRGGMGVVYRARDLYFDRVVAVKRLLSHDAATPGDLARFAAEARAAGRLNHPHVVSVFAAYAHEGQPYLVMQHVAGSTLAKRLVDGPISALESARLLAPVARAVQHAHEQGVLHRDLKPSNILLDAEGHPFVSDFGLAKRVDLPTGSGESLTQTGAVLGTPSYMAPEQAGAGHGSVGPAADVYSLGAILYQMLTGRPPFLAATPLDTLLLVREQDPVPPRVLNPRANADLAMIALKCLQKSPSLRYPNAASLAEDLDAFLLGAPVSARSTDFRDLVTRLLGSTQHAAVAENFGALFMMHSVVMLCFFGLTTWLGIHGVSARWPYVLIFTAGLGAWASVFWTLRRRGGPISFVERLLAHVWGTGVVGINLLFYVEWLMNLPVLTLAPVLGIIGGSLFMIQGGMLSGSFYLQAALMFLAIAPMAWQPRYAPLIFGSVSAACFFLTGLRAHLRRRRLSSGDSR
jgi:eukaryotic-like serine/threonine-protein kinase